MSLGGMNDFFAHDDTLLVSNGWGLFDPAIEAAARFGDPRVAAEAEARARAREASGVPALTAAQREFLARNRASG
jgi:hypothetical protein